MKIIEINNEKLDEKIFKQYMAFASARVASYRLHRR
jgi:hypothetical protein